MTDTKQYLDDLDKTHKPTDVPETGFTEYPDGRYQVRLDRIYIDKSKASQRMQLIIEFEIITGDYAFRKINKYAGLTTVENLDFATRDLRRLGVSQDFKWNELPDKHFPKLLDKTYEIELKTTTSKKDGKEYQNTWITKEIVTVENKRL